MPINLRRRAPLRTRLPLAVIHNSTPPQLDSRSPLLSGHSGLLYAIITGLLLSCVNSHAISLQKIKSNGATNIFESTVVGVYLSLWPAKSYSDRIHLSDGRFIQVVHDEISVHNFPNSLLIKHPDEELEDINSKIAWRAGSLLAKFFEGKDGMYYVCLGDACARITDVCPPLKKLKADISLKCMKPSRQSIIEINMEK